MYRDLRPQRNFQFLSILGFGATLISTWEINVTYAHLTIAVRMRREKD
jgi:hypothetical protein